jgi:hypothetical protein
MFVIPIKKLCQPFIITAYRGTKPICRIKAGYGDIILRGATAGVEFMMSPWQFLLQVFFKPIGKLLPLRIHVITIMLAAFFNDKPVWNTRFPEPGND